MSDRTKQRSRLYASDDDFRIKVEIDGFISDFDNNIRGCKIKVSR